MLDLNNKSTLKARNSVYKHRDWLLLEIEKPHADTKLLMKRLEITEMIIKNINKVFPF